MIVYIAARFYDYTDTPVIIAIPSLKVDLVGEYKLLCTRPGYEE